MTEVAVREVDSLIKTSGGDGTIGSDESFVDFCDQFDALLRPIDAETVIVDWQNDRVNRKQTRYKKFDLFLITFYSRKIPLQGDMLLIYCCSHSQIQTLLETT